jgi:hypothetical protein
VVGNLRIKRAIHENEPQPRSTKRRKIGDLSELQLFCAPFCLKYSFEKKNNIIWARFFVNFQN